MVSVDTRFGICVAIFNFSYIHSDMLKCLTQDHSWLGDSVVVGECKEPMGMPSDSLDTSSTKIPRKKAVLQNVFFIEISKPLVICLKKNQEKIEKELSQLHATISVDTEAEQVTISPCIGSEGMEDWKANCQSVVDLYLKSLITETVSFPIEIKNVMLPVVLDIVQNQPLLHTEYDSESSVVITGEKVKVDQVKERLEEVYESQMIKKESVPIENDMFFSFLQVKLDGLLTNHPEVKATVQAYEKSVSISGTNANRIAFKEDLDSLKYNMFRVKARISKDLVEFLHVPQGGTLLHQYLQGFESLVAVYFNPKGELFLLSNRKGDGIKVAKNIQENISSAFVIYPEAFVPSLKGKE